MSIDLVKAFAEKIRQDPSLLKKIQSEGANVTEIAKSAGFSITDEDLSSFRKSLSPEELENVAGGAGRGSGTTPVCTGTCMQIGQ